jgi:hypothetical protein
MRHLLVAMTLLAAGCAVPPPAVAPAPEAPRPTLAPSTPVVANAGFETPLAAGRACPPRWACSVHADGSSFRFAIDDSTFVEGRQSLLIERVGKEPWAVVAQSFRAPSLRGQRIRFSIAVRTQDVDGDGAGPWFLVNGDSDVLDHQVRRVRGTQDWQRHAIEIVVPEKAESFSVGATLEGGGRAWFDEARLEVLGPASRR